MNSKQVTLFLVDGEPWRCDAGLAHDMGRLGTAALRSGLADVGVEEL